MGEEDVEFFLFISVGAGLMVGTCVVAFDDEDGAEVEFESPPPPPPSVELFSNPFFVTNNKWLDDVEDSSFPWFLFEDSVVVVLLVVVVSSAFT